MTVMTREPILIIEDDHDIRVCFRQALENCGYLVYSVANGKDALTLLQKIEPPKLIILDLGMPIMTGEEFLKHKDLDEKLRSIPTLVVSCYEERVKKLQPNPTMLKPVDVDLFVSQVGQCLKVNSVLANLKA